MPTYYFIFPKLLPIFWGDKCLFNMAYISYTTLSHYFARVKHLASSLVGQLIGGKVEENIKANIFKNACAIKLSYAFNYSGLPISKYDGKVSSGKDKKWYFIFTDCNWTNASGHVDLFNGKEVEGHGYFNEYGIAMLYKLK